MSEVSTQSDFDKWSAVYDKDVVDDAHPFPFEGYGALLDLVVTLAGARPGLRVLDVGTGTGNLASRLLASGCTVWGVDFSTDMLARAREKHPSDRFPGLRFLRLDLLDEEWPVLQGERFDRIVSAYVFHEFQLATKARILRRLATRHLQPDGWLVVADVAFPNEAVREQRREEWADVWEEEHYWAAREAVPVVEAAGLSVQYRQVSRCGGIFTFRPTES